MPPLEPSSSDGLVVSQVKCVFCWSVASMVNARNCTLETAFLSDRRVRTFGRTQQDKAPPQGSC